MPRRLQLLAAAVSIALAACGGEVPEPIATSALPTVVGSGSGTVPPATPAPTATVTSSPAPDLPAGVPSSFGEDVPGKDVPPEALIPPGTEVSNRWMADTDAGEVIVVGYFKPGGDPFIQARGVVEWRRNQGAVPPWTPVFGISHPKSEGILGFDGVTGDATGDGSDDLLLQEATGGSGACGTYRVIDLAGAQERWTKMLCDARVDMNSDPIGLAVEEAVYAPGDPHCCPSGFRTTVFVYHEGQGFTKESTQSTPA